MFLLLAHEVHLTIPSKCARVGCCLGILNPKPDGLARKVRARVHHAPFCGKKGCAAAGYSIGKTADGYALVKAPRGRRRRRPRRHRHRRRRTVKVDMVSLTRRSLVE